MPEQLSTQNPTHARAANFSARRLARVASLCFGVAACAAAPAFATATNFFAQNAATPQTQVASPATATQTAKPADAKVKARDAKAKTGDAQKEKKPAPSNAPEITRARRAAAPAAASSVAPPSAEVKPFVAPSPAAAAPPVASPAVAVSLVASPAAAASKLRGTEAELERLRAEIKDTKAGAERTRLQRALVERLVELKREPEALDALRLMIHEDRYDPPFFFNTGNALARLSDASAAEDAYRKAIQQRRGNYSRALNNLGVILIRQGHWDEAQETFAAALRQENYAYAEASYNLGRLHLLRGEADLAIREWTRTLRLEPAHAEAAVALARAYAADGDTNRGLAVLDNFVARSARAGDGGIPREIAEARRELVAAAGVSEDTDADTNAKPGARDGAGLRHVSSDANLRGREVDRATYKLLQTARARREQGSREESVEHYREVLARSPAGYFAPANLELGGVLINLERDEEAIAALLPLAERDGARYPVAFYYLGRLYEHRGELARAAAHFARAAELYGDTNPQVLIDLSRTREKLNDPAGALDAMNTYAAYIARQGTVPAWVAERQAKLKEKISTTQTSTAAKP
ncbi:MAG TPA: tetratricopeptide repeat protein [Pyrinomonadaceae bacterium]|jgi:tetratricopeptide (TPR) repeat protein|nr:tetratricopeptide repeat protein [Pyrinomonadaceae bacterium]